MELHQLLTISLLACLATMSAASELQTFIVHVAPPPAKAGIESVSAVDLQSYYKSFLPAATDSAGDSTRMVYSYSELLNGFAARLTNEELESMAKKDGFIHAYPDRSMSLLTTRTPQFLGLNMAGGVWGNTTNFGEGVIVGVIDSGLTPGHPSYSGKGIPPPPSKWKGNCDQLGDLAKYCNNKLIGARVFLSGSEAAKGSTAGPAATPVDEDGHGTHTSTTAAGAMVPGAQVLGQAYGTATGIAPRAHLAMYRVCAEDCFDSDILAGMDAAVSDGVDVLSLSLGGFYVTFFNDPIAVGGFSAVSKGIFVSTAAANLGPFESSLSNEAPWLLTVAASTMDRQIRTTVQLGNGVEIHGESIYQPKNFPSSYNPLVYAGNAGLSDTTGLCANGSLDSAAVRGKVVACERGGGIARIDKSKEVLRAGGAAMILLNQQTDGYTTLADAHALPASSVSFVDAIKIKSYINSTKTPKAAILFKGTILGTSPAPTIASFSSRGPSLASPGILKPDITGPGVSVLAAWPFPVGPMATGSSNAFFNIMSGTSMSTPHLAGIAALIKAAHPAWSPAMIKSAIMTTADTYDHDGELILDERLLPANIFATGAGHVNPTKATDPGLVYDTTTDEYISYLCGLGYTSAQVSAIARGRSINCNSIKAISEADLNYPSISVFLNASKPTVVVPRTVTNVGHASSTYLSQVVAPAGVSVSVTPKVLQFSAMNEKKMFWVNIKLTSGSSSAKFSQGSLKWISGMKTVRSPIVVIFN